MADSTYYRSQYVVVPVVRSFRHTVYGVKTHFIEGGNGDPVILLHGGLAGMSGEMAWSDTVPALAEHFRTMALDMISFGYSDKPRIDYSFQTLVEHLAGFIDVMGFEKVNLVGQSQGAYIAAKYTADYPERVNRLAVINTGTLSTAMGIDTEPSPQEGGQNDGSKEALRRSLEFRMYRKEKITDDMLETKLALAAQPGMKEARRSMRAYRISLENDPNQTQVFSLRTRLPHVTVPMCIIWGVEDRSAPVRLGRALRELFPQAEYHEVQEAGHHSFLDQPEVVNDLLIRFLSTAD